MLSRKVPREVRELGGKPIRWARLAAEDAWLVLYAEKLVVSAPEGVEERAWHEFEHASWDGESRTLTITFVDSSIAPFVLPLAEGEKEKMVLVVRERLERSIVHRSTRELAGGVIARGMVRRGAGDSLFTQVVVDGGAGVDEAELAHFEADLRDVVGL